MYKIIGGQKLEGTIKISGSKNALLPLIAASLLVKGITVFNNTSNITDVLVMLDILKEIGISSVYDDSIIVHNDGNFNTSIVSEKPSKIRGSYYFIGALLATKGNVRIRYPGGCNIGSRKIDVHLEGLKKMGCQIKEDDDYLDIKGPMKGAVIDCAKSVGATINLLLAAFGTKETTILLNPAIDPEVKEVINFLKKAGYQIDDGDQIIIENQPLLYGNLIYDVMPDRIEAITFLILGVLMGDFHLTNIRLEDIKQVVILLENAGALIEYKDDELWVSKSSIERLNVATDVYPGIPTDIQPFLTVLSLFAKQKSFITENIYENRFNYVHELKKMGANISINQKTLEIYPSKLQGAELTGLDLRGTTALAIAGLVSEGTTIIRNSHNIERGYENFINKLQEVKANISKWF